VLDQTGVVSITSENVATINPRLTQVGYQGLPVETGIYPNPVHTSNSSARSIISSPGPIS
jgi:hypothetical protein